MPLNLRRLRAYDYLSSDLLPQLKLITSTILYDIGHTKNDSSMQLAAIGGVAVHHRIRLYQSQTFKPFRFGQIV